jgi:predicted Fe-Mo cluster-binding NifX family protein
VLLAEIEDGCVKRQEIQMLPAHGPSGVADFLGAFGVEKVVCGGVSHHLLDEMQRRGIGVIWGVIGPASEALVRLARGELECDQFVSKKCAGRRRRARQKKQSPSGSWHNGRHGRRH